MNDEPSTALLPFVLLFSEPLIREEGMRTQTRITRVERETTDDD
jgi:hypothetical protein